VDHKPIVPHIEKLGYYLLPKVRPTQPGYTGLLVAMRRVPTHRHFDPERLRVRLRDEHGFGAWRTLSLLSAEQHSQRVCAGMITLTDRIRKRVDFFSFGGSLEVSADEDETVYSLRSPAPVLWLTEHNESVADRLAAETSALLARIEAQWIDDEGSFSRLLAEADPIHIYSGTICSIVQGLDQYGSIRETSHGLYAILQDEELWLKSLGLWPQIPCLLEDLLSPPSKA
jgi:hypothetical protein